MYRFFEVLVFGNLNVLSLIALVKMSWLVEVTPKWSFEVKTTCPFTLGIKYIFLDLVAYKILIKIPFSSGEKIKYCCRHLVTKL